MVEGGRKEGRKGVMEGGRKEGRKGVMEGGRKEGRKGVMEGGRKEGRRKEGRKEEGRKEGRSQLSISWPNGCRIKRQNNKGNHATEGIKCNNIGSPL